MTTRKSHRRLFPLPRESLFHHRRRRALPFLSVSRYAQERKVGYQRDSTSPTKSNMRGTLLLAVTNSLKEVAVVASKQPPTVPLWKSERGTRLSVREMSRMIHQRVQVCATRNLVPDSTTPHSLRHTFSTRYPVRHPGDLVGLAWVLGHSSVRTTQISVQPTEEEIAERVSQIDLNAYAD